MEEINLQFVAEVEKHPELYNFTCAAYSRKDVTERAWTEIGRKFNFTANESKEKWRNLRNAFVKNMKPPASGASGRKKKAYYLSEAMKFALPFVKVVSATSGNLPEVPVSDQHIISNDDSIVDGESESLDQPELPSSQAMLPSPPPSTSRTLSQASPSTATPHTSAALPGPSDVSQNPASVGRKRRAIGNEDTDKRIAEYFSAKMKYVEMKHQAQKIPKHSESLKMFLLSLLPDLEALPTTLIRKFKIKTLGLIEELTEEASTSSSSTTPIFSPESSSAYSPLPAVPIETGTYEHPLGTNDDSEPTQMSFFSL